jgi:hypothetical protein
VLCQVYNVFVGTFGLYGRFADEKHFQFVLLYTCLYISSIELNNEALLEDSIVQIVPQINLHNFR